MDTRIHNETPAISLVRRQVWLAYALAWSAAFCDAVGFMTLQQLGASFMSGNSMVTGVALGQWNGVSFLNHGVPILSFVIGLTLGILVVLQVKYWGFRSPFAVVFALEFLCILAFLMIGNSVIRQGIIPNSHVFFFYLCTVLLTLAMGLQTATVKKIDGQGIRTTFVTGLLSDLVGNLITYLTWLHTHCNQHGLRLIMRASREQTSFQYLLWLSSTWACYVVGAACGGALVHFFSLNALCVPLLLLFFLIVVDIVQPLENKE